MAQDVWTRQLQLSRYSSVGLVIKTGDGLKIAPSGADLAWTINEFNGQVVVRRLSMSPEVRGKMQLRAKLDTRISAAVRTIAWCCRSIVARRLILTCCRREMEKRRKCGTPHSS